MGIPEQALDNGINHGADYGLTSTPSWFVNFKNTDVWQGLAQYRRLIEQQVRKIDQNFHANFARMRAWLSLPFP